MNCRCDEQLAYSLAELAGTYGDNQYVTNADGSGFDHAGQCHAIINSGGNGGENGGGNGGGNGGNNLNELQCCGTYPNRFEFWTHGGSRACCGEVTYNKNRLDCCDDDSLGQIGTCDARR